MFEKMNESFIKKISMKGSFRHFVSTHAPTTRRAPAIVCLQNYALAASKIMHCLPPKLCIVCLTLYNFPSQEHRAVSGVLVLIDAIILG